MDTPSFCVLAVRSGSLENFLSVSVSVCLSPMSHIASALLNHREWCLSFSFPVVDALAIHMVLFMILLCLCLRWRVLGSLGPSQSSPRSNSSQRSCLCSTYGSNFCPVANVCLLQGECYLSLCPTIRMHCFVLVRKSRLGFPPSWRILHLHLPGSSGSEPCP